MVENRAIFRFSDTGFLPDGRSIPASNYSALGLRASDASTVRTCTGRAAAPVATSSVRSGSVQGDRRLIIGQIGLPAEHSRQEQKEEHDER